MDVLTVRHLTQYRYTKPVWFGEHRPMLRPRESLLDFQNLRRTGLRARNKKYSVSTSKFNGVSSLVLCGSTS
jgi:Bacterial transglutaminase-like N-terminal region